MNFVISLNDIASLSFDDKFKNFLYIGETHANFFFDKPGVEHYRLLSYLSSKFNNIKIFDVGTFLGYSALALSYNENNTVYTFDICNFVTNENIKNRLNIKFLYENLFDESVQPKWVDTIKECPFIFLDVNPHNGLMEMQFINFLRKINYDGIILCDDIHLNPEMRDIFWECIPKDYKYDITKLGHWSGTGAITFNKKVSFELI
jgi:hypothetical protein